MNPPYPTVIHNHACADAEYTPQERILDEPGEPVQLEAYEIERMTDPQIAAIIGKAGVELEAQAPDSDTNQPLVGEGIRPNVDTFTTSEAVAAFLFRASRIVEPPEDLPDPSDVAITEGEKPARALDLVLELSKATEGRKPEQLPAWRSRTLEKPYLISFEEGGTYHQITITLTYPEPGAIIPTRAVMSHYRRGHLNMIASEDYLVVDPTASSENSSAIRWSTGPYKGYSSRTEQDNLHAYHLAKKMIAQIPPVSSSTE